MGKRVVSVMRKVVKTILVAGLLFNVGGLWAACTQPVDSTRFSQIPFGVKDKQTGLMWKRCPIGAQGPQCSQGLMQRMSWEQALALTPKSADPYRWRLPTVDELASIADPKCAVPALQTQLFPNTPSARFWAAHTNASDKGSSASAAGYVDFERGERKAANPLNRYHVRLVRTLRLEERVQ